MIRELLDTVVTAKVSRAHRVALAEIARECGVTESELLRSLLLRLIRLWEDVKSQAALGASLDDVVGRSARFAVSELVGRSPEELRRLGKEVQKALEQLAALKEQPEGGGMRADTGSGTDERQ